MDSLEHRRDVAALVVLKLQDLLCSHHLQATWTHENTAGMLQHWTSYAATTYKQHGFTRIPQGCCSTGGVEAAGPSMQPPPTSNMDSLEHRRDVAALVVLKAAGPPMQPPPTSNMDSLEHRRDVAALVVLKLQDLLCSHHLQATWTH
ncbi:hypothetical protein Pmani_022524 [Petrolisthes manimaculis]|uniref:Uncharacterized protein n=1 Tax=Petrolisthes manimaculis TaxID=1843537 RepID=A0AAE1U207_9EUCA|nr:hypothetical protein Pmani_022524 [Petrolisthes manimaculis]